MRRLLILTLLLLLAACSSAPTPTAAPTAAPTPEAQIESAESTKEGEPNFDPLALATDEARASEQDIMEALGLYLQADLLACELPHGAIAMYLVVEDARAEVADRTDCAADSVYATGDPNAITSRDGLSEAIANVSENVTPEQQTQLIERLTNAANAVETLSIEDDGTTARLTVGDQEMVFRLVDGEWYFDPSP